MVSRVSTPDTVTHNDEYKTLLHNKSNHMSLLNKYHPIIPSMNNMFLVDSPAFKRVDKLIKTLQNSKTYLQI